MHLLPQEGILFVAFAIIVILLIACVALFCNIFDSPTRSTVVTAQTAMESLTK